MGLNLLLAAFPSLLRCQFQQNLPQTARWLEGYLKKGTQLPWCEAGPPNHLHDNVDSDQKVVNKEISLSAPNKPRSFSPGIGHFHHPFSTECINQLVSESQLPHKIVNLVFTITY